VAVFTIIVYNIVNINQSKLIKNQSKIYAKLFYIARDKVLV
jgi:hypothetical protein